MAHLLTTAGGENVLKKKIEYSQLKSVMNTRYGRSDRTRTCGLMVPNHPLYQLSHTPIIKNYNPTGAKSQVKTKQVTISYFYARKMALKSNKLFTNPVSLC